MTACGTTATSPSLVLTEADRLHAPDFAKPDFAKLDPPKPTGAEERAYLTEVVIKPLARFSLAQEATVAAERQRADGVIGKVDALGRAMKPKRLFGWKWAF